MKYAWIENNRVRDTCEDLPEAMYTPDIAVFYSTQVPAYVLRGAELVNNVWENPIIVPLPSVAEVVQVVKPPTVSAIEYKMLFTPQERIASKVSADPIIMDLQELLNDPRTTNVDLSLNSISNALDYMTTIGILDTHRKAEILTGIIT